ncbi:MAG: hypothetical protein M3N07_05535 [Pseudomonadota bacterium]|nr:hypothetical protein [Pseudomonadota bacterium]
MHRFYFNIEDGASLADTEGAELPDVQAARLEAVRLTGQILKDQPELLWERRDFEMHVTNEERLVLFTIQVLATDAPVLQIEVIPQTPA